MQRTLVGVLVCLLVVWELPGFRVNRVVCCYSLWPPRPWHAACVPAVAHRCSRCLWICLPRCCVLLLKLLCVCIQAVLSTAQHMSLVRF